MDVTLWCILDENDIMKKIFTLLCATALALGTAAQDASDVSKLQLGLQAGVGYMGTMGDLHDYFKGGAEFTAGLTADYSRLRLKADVSYVQPDFNAVNMFGITDDNGRDAQINKNSSASQVSLGVQLGYKVWQSGRVSVTPAAGMFYTHYSWDVSNIEWFKDDAGNDYFNVTSAEDVSMGKVSWMASIDVDVRIHQRNTTEPFFLNGRYSRLSSYVRITPWVAGGKLTDTNPSKSGVYAGITLRLTGFMQSLGF